MSAIEQPSVTNRLAPGASLRQARERAGLSLDEIARRTMIPVSRLRALENDAYAQIGVATFVLGYTRTYARAVGVDAEPLVKYLEAALPAQSSPAVEAPPLTFALDMQKQPRSVFWPITLVAVCLLGLVAFIGISTVRPPESQTAAPPAPAVAGTPAPATSNPAPQVSTTAAEAPVSGTQPAAQETDRLPAPAAGVGAVQTLQATRVASFAPAGAEVPRPAAVAVAPGAIASVATVDAAEPAPAAVSTRGARLSISFRDQCWLGVTDATGKRIVARLVASGDNLQLFGQPPFDVMLGNAAAVDMKLDGQPVEAIPPAGRRALRLKVGQ